MSNTRRKVANKEGLVISSFNCKNVKTSMDEIRELCKFSDIVFLQETWLTDKEIPILSQISNDFYAKGISSIDTSSHLLSGRPYGGLAILWKKTIGAFIKPRLFDDSRVMGIEISSGINHTILALNVYLPFSCHENLNEYVNYLCRINGIMETAGTSLCMALGDFNADLSNRRVSHLFGRELLSFCNLENLIINDYHLLDRTNTYTFINSSSSTMSWLDHIISTSSLDAIIKDITVQYKFVSSDHLPLTVTLDVIVDCIKSPLNNNETSRVQIQWEKLTSDELLEYSDYTEKFLKEIFIDTNVISCSDYMCDDVSHVAYIDKLYGDIVMALGKAGNQFAGSHKKRLTQQILGWNAYCKESHAIARDSFLYWRSLGSPRTGPVYHHMNTTRRHFKLMLRKCRKEREKISADKLANKLLAKDTKGFWREVSKSGIDNIQGQAVTVGGATGCREICDMWKNHYSALLNSSTNTSKKFVVTDSLRDLSDADSINISMFEVKAAIKKLKKGKTKGRDNLSSEHIQYAHDRINVLLAILFNLMFLHGHVPIDLMDTIVISLIKDKKGSITDKDNYRPIAITCVISKVLELLILEKYSQFLETSCHQFGFKKDHSTDNCIFVLKEIVNYYNMLASPVFVCMLDASKAFDRINHYFLFDKLLQRGMPKLVVRLLLFWYREQLCYVKWDDALSSPFKVANGVRQGGVLSPMLFNVFIDDLSRKLISSNIGCYMNNVCYNHV